MGDGVDLLLALAVDRPRSRSSPRDWTHGSAPVKAAIAAGYGHYTRGVDPEYNWYQDRDSDGIDCEHR